LDANGGCDLAVTTLVSNEWKMPDLGGLRFGHVEYTIAMTLITSKIVQQWR